MATEEKAAVTPGAQIAVVVPTFNEAGNVAELVARLATVLEGRRWEVIFVDDHSTDGTAEAVTRISRSFSPVRLVFRPSRRGLSSAVLEGIFATTAEYVVVMDADLQHDETIIPQMLDVLETGATRMAVGSRLAEGGGNSGMTAVRRRISDWSNRLARAALGRDVGDLMSGFFAFRKDDVAPIAMTLKTGGFKILLDILFRFDPADKVVEIPYTFRKRASGSSKLGLDAATSFILMIVDRFLGRIVSQRFVKFCVVGSLGVIVHFTLMTITFRMTSLDFALSQFISTLVAACFNYTLNNRWTYGDVALSGKAWVLGLFKFLLISAVGIAANVGVAAALHENSFSWQLSAIAGIAMGVFWNYMMTKISVWKV